MRSAYLVCVFVIQLSLVACSSGDDVAGNSGDEVVGNSSEAVVSNPLFGKWKVESMQDADGEVGLPEGSENGYWEFSPSKMVIGDGDRVVDTGAVLEYIVEDERVMVTTETDGEKNIIQIQLLDGDRLKWERDESTGANVIMYRVGDASSE